MSFEGPFPHKTVRGSLNLKIHSLLLSLLRSTLFRDCSSVPLSPGGCLWLEGCLLIVPAISPALGWLCWTRQQRECLFSSQAQQGVEQSPLSWQGVGLPGQGSCHCAQGPGMPQWPIILPAQWEDGACLCGCSRWQDISPALPEGQWGSRAGGRAGWLLTQGSTGARAG